MKKLFNIFILLILLGIISFVSLIQYIKTEHNTGISKDGFNNLVNEIKSAPHLPDSFITEYVIVEDTLNLKQVLWNDITDESHKSCPCSMVSNFFIPIMSIKNKARFNLKTRHIGLTLNLEKVVSQKECLNYYLNTFDFIHHPKGANEASKYYFNKPLERLSSKEMRTLILMLKNPFLFNPKRNPERLEHRLKLIEEKLNNVK